MKNINYDLLKLLSTKLDMIAHLERCYIADAADAKCHSLVAQTMILEDEKRHVDMLRNEIEMRVKAGLFD